MSPTAHKIDDTKELLEESFGESILRQSRGLIQHAAFIKINKSASTISQWSL